MRLERVYLFSNKPNATKKASAKGTIEESICSAWVQVRQSGKNALCWVCRCKISYTLSSFVSDWWKRLRLINEWWLCMWEKEVTLECMHAWAIPRKYSLLETALSKLCYLVIIQYKNYRSTTLGNHSRL